jgi:Glycosyl hydrolases family 2, sugar binding domain.
MAFGFDITDKISYDQDNVIALRIDNNWKYRERSTNSTFQWNNSSFNANYGGIPKNVKLHVSGKIYQTLPLYSFLKTTGVYVYAKDFDIKDRKATISAESEVKNETSAAQNIGYEVVIEDMGRKRNSPLFRETSNGTVWYNSSTLCFIYYQRTTFLELGIWVSV